MLKMKKPRNFCRADTLLNGALTNYATKSDLTKNYNYGIPIQIGVVNNAPVYQMNIEIEPDQLPEYDSFHAYQVDFFYNRVLYIATN